MHCSNTNISGKPIEKQGSLKTYGPGFFILCLFCVGIQVISSNNVLDRYGLKEELWGFIFGIVAGNLLSFVNGMF
jgi:hypothetical protein